MSIILSIAVDGIAYGMILFMISVGLSVTMGLMRVINLAHGGFAMIGGAFCHVLSYKMGMPFFAATILAILITIAIAIPLERVIYRRVYGLGELEQVLATIGLVFLMVATANFFLGADQLTIRLPAFMSETVNIGVRTITIHRVMVIIAGGVIVLGLWLVLDKTRFGVNLRATVDNAAIASALGIDTSKVFAIAFSIGAGLAAFGGIMGAELLPIIAFYPLQYLVLFLIVVAVGGLGSIWGSLLASLALGILQTATLYLASEWSAIIFYAVIMLILAIRPQGLLGKV